MQDPYRILNQKYQKPTLKPQRRHIGSTQPTTFTQLNETSKSALSKGVKRQKKRCHDAQYGSERIHKAASWALSQTSVVDTMKATEGDSRAMYKALKRKYTTLEEESFQLLDELEKTDSEVKKLEEQKFSLLDELLMLEGLAHNPFPIGGQSEAKNISSFLI